MSERGGIESIQQPSPFPEHVSAIFARLDVSDVEQFYKSYSLWSLQQRIEILRIETEALQQAIVENDRLQQQVRPSAIALASLAQLQASGVNDIDLLDRMLERGEDWLDHTIQLLRHCEELDVIGGNYTQWCENALEGAYDWIESMNDSGNDAPAVDAQPKADIATEELLLQKLMSEDEQAEKLPVADHQSEEPVAVAESAPEEVAILEDESADTTDSEDDNSPTMKRPALTGIQRTDATQQTQSSVPQVRQKSSRHFLRRLLASFWHD